MACVDSHAEIWSLHEWFVENELAQCAIFRKLDWQRRAYEVTALLLNLFRLTGAPFILHFQATV